MQEKITLSLTMEQIEAVKRELVRSQLLDALNGIRKPRENRTWARKFRAAEALYGHSEPLRGVRKKLLQIWALTWYGIFEAKRRLEAINREP